MKPMMPQRIRCRTITAAALLALSLTATAASPIWANAAQVQVTDTTCGAVRSLTLRQGAVAAAKQPGAALCAATEETFDAVFISGKFLRRGNKGPIAETDVDVRRVACAKGVALLILGPAADTERALREHPAQPGCKVTKVRYQQVSSAGNIPFVNIPETGTMSVAESLAMHQKERNQIIAECDASPSCRADRNRMSNGSGKKIYTCPPGYYPGGSLDNPYASCYPTR
jgi:hypothetical protein